MTQPSGYSFYIGVPGYQKRGRGVPEAVVRYERERAVMRKIGGLKEAATHTGLSIHELRSGALSGKYPHMRVGGERGKFLFDLDLLDKEIERLMLANIEPSDREAVRGQIRAVK